MTFTISGRPRVGIRNMLTSTGHWERKKKKRLHLALLSIDINYSPNLSLALKAGWPLIPCALEDNSNHQSSYLLTLELTCRHFYSLLLSSRPHLFFRDQLRLSRKVEYISKEMLNIQFLGQLWYLVQGDVPIKSLIVLSPTFKMF